MSVVDAAALAAEVVVARADGRRDRVAAVVRGLSWDDVHAVLWQLGGMVDPDMPARAVTDPTAPTPHQVVGHVATVVAHTFGINVGLIYGRDLGTEATAARHVVCWVAHRRRITSTATGQVLGRDHSTVLHSIRRVEQTPRLLACAHRVARAIDTPRAVPA